jgi:hypothetical protein
VLTETIKCFASHIFRRLETLVYDQNHAEKKHDSCYSNEASLALKSFAAVNALTDSLKPSVKFIVTVPSCWSQSSIRVMKDSCEAAKLDLFQVRREVSCM